MHSLLECMEAKEPAKDTEKYSSVCVEVGEQNQITPQNKAAKDRKARVE